MKSFEVKILDHIELRFSVLSEYIEEDEFDTYFQDHMNKIKDILHDIMNESDHRYMSINIMENDKLIETKKYTKDEFILAFNIDNIV